MSEAKEEPCTRYIVEVVYRDYEVRYEKFPMPESKIDDFSAKLFSSDNIRAVRIYGPQVFYAHKSFAEDFDPERMLEGLNALVNPTMLKSIEDSRNGLLEPFEFNDRHPIQPIVSLDDQIER